MIQFTVSRFKFRWCTRLFFQFGLLIRCFNKMWKTAIEDTFKVSEVWGKARIEFGELAKLGTGDFNVHILNKTASQQERALANRTWPGHVQQGPSWGVPCDHHLWCIGPHQTRTPPPLAPGRNKKNHYLPATPLAGGKNEFRRRYQHYFNTTTFD